MTQTESVEVICPVCGRQFTAPAQLAGSRVPCPHCQVQVKIAGGTTSGNDDDQWLSLNDDLPPPTPVAPKPAEPSPRSEPQADQDWGEFQIPDLPPATAFPSANPVAIPPLSEADLEALSGFATQEDQLPAPVKIVRDEKADEAFRVKCPICESLTYARPDQVGKRIRCGDCHSTITVPAPPKAKPKYVPDIEATKPFTFQDSGTAEPAARPANPFRKSADDYLRTAEAAMEDTPDDDWTVPSVGQWLTGVLGVFRDPAVIAYWFAFTALAAIPTMIAIAYQSSIVVMGLFAGGVIFGMLLISHGFAIMQAIANGEKRVTEWPTFDPWEWMGTLWFAGAALIVSAAPAWFAGQYFWGASLVTVFLTMTSLYLLYPFVLLSMLDEQSVFMPFSAAVGKSVTRSSEQWGGLYLSSALLFFVLFLTFMIASIATPIAGAVIAIAALVAGTFIYFNLLGQLAFAVGQSVNAAPMVNDVKRSPKMPQ